MPKTKVEAAVRINAYEVISRAVEEGLRYGYRRAYKYTEDPSEEHILEELRNTVMASLSEVLQYDDPEG